MRRRPFLAALLGAVLGAACVSTSTAGHPDTGTTRPAAVTTPVTVGAAERGVDVGFLGDSLLFEIGGKMDARLPGARLVVQGVPGLTSLLALPLVAAIREQQPVAVAVVIGTNDALRTGGRPKVADLRALADRLAWVPCIRWVTVTEDTVDPFLRAGAPVVNEELAALVAGRPGAALVPWHELVAEHRDWLEEDGVHHSPTGEEALADHVAAALRSCPGVG